LQGLPVRTTPMTGTNRLRMAASTRSGQAGNAAGARGRGDADGPLYLQLTQALRDEIVTGRYPVGSQLPTEDELRERFAVSRFTVREAIRRLREEGLVTSRQGAGTTVVPMQPAETQELNTVSIEDILAFGTDTRLVVDSIRLAKVEGRLAKRAGVEKGDEWLVVTGFRRAEREPAPICWVEYFIHRDYAAIGRQLPRHTGPIFPLIEDVFAVSIAEVQQDISAATVGAALANRLHVPEDSAALEIRRVYRTDNGKIVQITISTHPAATYRHSMTMRRVKR
jgi:GntR family transcriptional regulator